MHRAYYEHTYGESWLAIKDSSTHRPSSQGWASSILLLCLVNSFVYLCLWIFCGWREFPSLLSLFLYNAWYAIHYKYAYITYVLFLVIPIILRSGINLGQAKRCTGYSYCIYRGLPHNEDHMYSTQKINVNMYVCT